MAFVTNIAISVALDTGGVGLEMPPPTVDVDGPAKDVDGPAVDVDSPAVDVDGPSSAATRSCASISIRY